MNLYEYLNDSWFLVWCALWLGWPLCAVLVGVFVTLPKILIRSLIVCLRGWPPEHLNIRGEFKKTEDNREWISVKDAKNIDGFGYCWIVYKGEIKHSYLDENKRFRFSRHQGSCYMSECISKVMIIKKPEPPEE